MNETPTLKISQTAVMKLRSLQWDVLLNSMFITYILAGGGLKVPPLFLETPLHLTDSTTCGTGN